MSCKGGMIVNHVKGLPLLATSLYVIKKQTYEKFNSTALIDDSTWTTDIYYETHSLKIGLGILETVSQRT